MGTKKDISLKQREKRLIELIEDAKELKFKSKVVKQYEAQLKEVQAEIKADKEKKSKLRKSL